MAKVKKPIAVLPGIWEWDRERVIEEVLPSGASIRLTVGWLSGYQNALYKTMARQMFAHAQEKFGFEPSEFLEAEEKAGMSPLGMKFSSMWQRCWMLAGLRKVEVKAIGGEWQESELPPSWTDIDKFTYAVPSNIYEPWRDAVIELNPQLFSVNQSEPEKKDEPPEEIA